MNKKKINNKTVTIGIPCLEMLYAGFVKCFLSMQKPECMVHIQERSVVHYSRNLIVEAMLNLDKTDYLFFLDSDMMFHEDVLMRLLEHDKDIIGALAFKRTEPHIPCIMKKREDGYHNIVQYPQGLFEIDAIGMAGTLIKREVLEKMTKPYFHFDNGLGEDMNFCKEAQAKGFRIWTDSTIKMGHITQKTITEKDYIKCAEKKAIKSKFTI